MIRRARVVVQFAIALTFTGLGCKKEVVIKHVDEGCSGASCLEEAEAALWEGDDSKAREPLTKLCNEEEDAFSCFRLGELWREGKGGPQDREKAARYYERSCKFLNEEGCEKRFELAHEGVGGAEVEMEYAVKACDGGRPKGCMGAAVLAESQGNNDRAAELFESACGQGEAEGCANAGDLLFDPKGPFANKARAFAAYNSACVGYNGHGCLQLGLLFFEGIGTEQNVDKARDQFKHACELGVDDGCRNQRRIERANGKDVTLRLTTETDALVAKGLEARDLTCKMDRYGEDGLKEALSAVARHRRKLHECVKKGGAPVGVRWTFEKGRVREVRGHRKLGRRYVGCVAKKLRKKGAPGEGSCSGVFLLGDAEEAAAALPPKEPPKPAEGDAAPEGRKGKSGLVNVSK